MVKLYRYSNKKNNWVFVGIGNKERAEKYAQQGYVVVHCHRKSK